MESTRACLCLSTVTTASQNDSGDSRSLKAAELEEDIRGRILQSVHTACSETDARPKGRADLLERTVESERVSVEPVQRIGERLLQDSSAIIPETGKSRLEPPW